MGFLSPPTGSLLAQCFPKGHSPLFLYSTNISFINSPTSVKPGVVHWPMRGEHLRKLFFFLWLAIVASLYLYQEKPTGLLAGKVVDAQGNPIAGALITLQHYPRQFKTRTTQDGNFKFAVPVGQYSSLYVKQKGYQQHYEYKAFKVVEGQTFGGLEFPLKKSRETMSPLS